MDMKGTFFLYASEFLNRRIEFCTTIECVQFFCVQSDQDSLHCGFRLQNNERAQLLFKYVVFEPNYLLDGTYVYI